MDSKKERKVQLSSKDLTLQLETMGLYGAALFCDVMEIGTTYKVAHPTQPDHGLEITKLYGGVYSVVMH